jgi:leucyl/phenylalanyl-tRNA---protein transferase
VSGLFGPDELLAAYARGVFPMADSREDPRLFLIDPDRRGVIPFERFHVPRRLARTVRQAPYRVTLNTAFDAVLKACAAPRSYARDTWINAGIIALYQALHQRQAAFSVECWNDDDLVGGLYGVSLGAAFFGESMFSTATDASKIALVHLVAILRTCGYQLLDTQFLTEHLQQFGALEISRARYRSRLAAALQAPAPARWPAEALPERLALQVAVGAAPAEDGPPPRA